MLIAEFCANHLGKKDVLKEMVYQAKAAGATFGKIQTFFAGDLSDEWKAKDYDRLKASELDWEAHGQFAQWCREVNLIPMTSVYSAKYLPQLHDLGFEYIKIGSAQADDVELITKYIKAGKKVILSTGGHALGALPRIHPMAGVLHCVSEYPSGPRKANLTRMLEIKKYWPNTPYGLSDHSDPLAADWDQPSRIASLLGATYIERHFSILARNETKDGPVSIDASQLKVLCDWDRLNLEEKLSIYPWYGTWVYPQSEAERELIHQYKGRWKQ